MLMIVSNVKSEWWLLNYTHQNNTSTYMIKYFCRSIVEVIIFPGAFGILKISKKSQTNSKTNENYEKHYKFKN